jgi:proline iminopeptidase
VVGTIFASKFPERTLSLVLEGTINGGGTNLWSAPYRVALLNHFLRTLPESLRQLVVDRTNSVPGLPPEWFSRMGQRAMYSPNFQKAFRTKIEQFVALSPQDALARYQFNFPDDDDGLLVEHYNSGPLFAHHILCQELSAHVSTGSFNAIFHEGKLVAKSDESMVSGCQLIETHPRFRKKIFHAQDYPLRVPVTYLQGMIDGATPYMEALQHFQGATGTQRQMVLVIEGGHSPVVQCLQEESPDATCPSPDTLSDMLGRAFMGEPLSSEQVGALGSKWKFAGRRADGTKFR